MTRSTQIMLAWDRPTFAPVDEMLLEELAPYIGGVKIGLQAMTTFSEHADEYQSDTLRAFVKDCLGETHGKKAVMWDSKLHDIGNTVEAAGRNITDPATHVDMLTFHTTISDEAISTVVRLCDDFDTLALGVTVLTDLSPEECVVRYGDKPEVVVPRLVKNAKKFGLRGLVCSPQELTALSEVGLLEGMTTVIPGIRPLWAYAHGQKRTMTPSEAAQRGARWIVVGRPILQPPGGMTPVQAAQRIFEELQAA